MSMTFSLHSLLSTCPFSIHHFFNIHFPFSNIIPMLYINLRIRIISWTSLLCCFISSMAQTEEKILQEHHEWLMIMDGHDSYSTSSSSNNTNNDGSACSSSSSNVDDDDASSKSNGPSFELSELMSNLPIKRGLSKYYEGKSQSFTSLAGIINIEDMAKKGRNIPHRRKIMKNSKSCGNGLDAHKLYTLPKPIISKKNFSSRTWLSSLAFPGTSTNRRGNFLTSTRPPPVPVQKKF